MHYLFVFAMIVVELSRSHAITRNQRYRGIGVRIHTSLKMLQAPQLNMKRKIISSRRMCHSEHNKFHVDSNSKYFEFDHLENHIYRWWEDSGYFKPSEDSSKKTFVIPMPPPNVTGYLHMGHALFVALQDIMARFHRMRGKSTLWLPGTDHAGIATQLLVERALLAEGSSRVSIGRGAFLDKVWKWKEEKGGYITKQMRRLGASADWSREKFTLDPPMSEAVTEAFVRLHEKGLIYKGNYMVNWSPNLQTAVSDLEVEYSEEEGLLYYFKYILSDDENQYIPVATTRPETIFGDSAVCVHPEDERYKLFIGKMVRVPFLNRDIPVIADEYVDKEFGTGALKVTPAHDVNDYELGKKHSLPSIKVLNNDATINEQGGPYRGLDRFECRKRMWNDMKDNLLAIKVEPHIQRVPRSQRGGEIIEPMISSQWFLKMENMADLAIEAVRSKEIQIVPDRFEKVWNNWLENIHDWCISRQLWWGHQIPVYYINGNSSNYIVARNINDAYDSARLITSSPLYKNLPPNLIIRKQYGTSVVLEQDPDVLDTWFSSGLWPFSTLGWPHSENSLNDRTDDFSRFYPTSVLETGYDILFFWVARMVMMGIELTGKSPFSTIYMHGLVRDGQGRKMSKTTGNVIDPIDTIEKFGCDALRFSLVTGCTPGQDISMSNEKIEANRNFANKLWNVGKYVTSMLDNVSEVDRENLAVSNTMSANELFTLPLSERYIVSKCHEVINEVTIHLENFEFGEAGKKLYEFLWDELADWYLEASKTRLKNADTIKRTSRVLIYTWDRSLRLMHPFMPFITEALWQSIPHIDKSIMITNWPQMEGQVLPIDQDSISSFQDIQSLVKAIRNARSEYNVEAGKKIGACICCSRPSLLQALLDEQAVISLLSRVDSNSLSYQDTVGTLSSDKTFVRLVINEYLDVFLPMHDMVDKEKEIQRLGKQAEKLLKDIVGLETRLISPGFMDKAPAKVVSEVVDTLNDKRTQLKSVQESMQLF